MECLGTHWRTIGECGTAADCGLVSTRTANFRCLFQDWRGSDGQAFREVQ